MRTSFPKAIVAVFALVFAALILLTNAQVRLWLVYFQEALINTLIVQPSLPSNNQFKPILQKGDVIVAKTKFMMLRIECLDARKRKYQWRETIADSWQEETVILKPADSLGRLYLPGNRSEDLLTFFGLKHNVVSQEGEQNYRTTTELGYWLKNNVPSYGAVYNSSGFLVGCVPNTPNIEVIQLKLNGHIPHNLLGACGTCQ